MIYLRLDLRLRGREVVEVVLLLFLIAEEAHRAVRSSCQADEHHDLLHHGLLLNSCAVATTVAAGGVPSYRRTPAHRARANVKRVRWYALELPSFSTPPMPAEDGVGAQPRSL